MKDGASFRVNTTTFGNQAKRDYAYDIDGNFVVVWLDYTLPDDPDIVYNREYDKYNWNGIYGQRFDNEGNRVGEEFKINKYDILGSWLAVEMDKESNFIVLWKGVGPEDIEGIYAQRFNKHGKPVGKEPW